MKAFYVLLTLLVAVQFAKVAGSVIGDKFITDNETAARLEACQRTPQGCP